MTILEQLKELAADPKYISDPPGLFVRSLGLFGASPSFVKAGWELFKQNLKNPTPAEIEQYIIKTQGESK